MRWKTGATDAHRQNGISYDGKLWATGAKPQPVGWIQHRGKAVWHGVFRSVLLLLIFVPDLPSA